MFTVRIEPIQADIKYKHISSKGRNQVQQGMEGKIFLKTRT